MHKRKIDELSSGGRPLTAIDLFAGAGGFSLAAKNCNIRLLAAVEYDKWARETYRKNFIDGKRNAPKHYGDITTLEPETLLADLSLAPEQLDILMGGPPCQGFSTHRINNAGVDDPRNDLLLRYFKFIEALRPKVFVVENVPGLLWKRHEEYLKTFLRLVDEAGYSLHGPRILNAKDYGVPQNRKRVFMVGVRKGLKTSFNWPTPTHFAPNSAEVLEKGKTAWVNASTILEKPLERNDPNAIHMNHSPSMVERFKATPLNGGSRKDSGYVLACHKDHDGHKDVYGRIDPNNPGPTMTTACVNPSKGRFVHPTESHGITVRHAARFQTFPDSFIFEGGLMAAAKQVGNAVPIQLGESVLSRLTATLADFYSRQGGSSVVWAD
jgi:DNA (cytosine-5)-methyltransferase 1